MDELLKLLNTGTSSAIQIIRTVDGDQPATLDAQGRVTSNLDSSGFIFIGIVAVLLIFVVLTQKGR